MKPSVVLAFSLLALSRIAIAVDADTQDLTELSIEELLTVDVISASRLGQTANKSASSASILTASDIRTYGWRTLAEALNGLRGLFTTNNRNYTFLGVRGFIQPNDYNSRVLIMIDGQRMNENVYDTANIAQEFMLDVDMIERIEFVPGSGSSVYGANAFLGMINVVTKNGRSLNGIQVAGEAGTFDTYKGRLSYGKKLANGADVLVSASHFDSAGVKNIFFPALNDPSTNNGIAHNMDGERADRLFGKFQFKELTVSGGFVDRFKRVPIAGATDIFNDPESATNDRQIYGNVKYDKAINDKTSLILQGYFQDYEYHGDTLYRYDGTRYVFHDTTKGSWFGGDAQLTTRAFDRQRLIAGLEYQYDLRQNLYAYETFPYYEYGNNQYNGHRVEAYLQDDITLRDDLVLSAGLRLDYHHMIKNLPLNPRIGLIWNPLSSTTLKLLYSSTFRAPNGAEFQSNSYYYGIDTVPREELIKSLESIVEWRSSQGLKVFGSLFLNDISSLITTNPENGLLENAGHYHIYGADLEIEKNWLNGRHFKASYTYSYVGDNSQSKETQGVGSPESLFKLHYAEPLFGDYAKLAIENIFVGERKTFQGNLADAYNLINVNLTSDRLVKGLDMSLGVYNLLDDNYQVVGDGFHDILKMNGREFRLKLVYTY